MGRKKYTAKRTKRGRRAAATVAAAAVLFCAAFLAVRHWKPDWIFLVRHQISMLAEHAELTEVEAEALKCREVRLEAGASGMPPEEKETLEDGQGGPWEPAAQGQNAQPASAQDTEEIWPDETLLLINGAHPLPSGYVPRLEEYGEGVRMSGPTAEAYELLAQDVEERFGTSLYIRSSYRSREEQEQEKEEQPDVAAAAGESEHETGLALDVYVPYYAGYAFLKSEAGQYVNENCWKYGFIIRYPFGKEEVTGIPFEPWHLRYTGIPHAELMYKNSWTLEEYLDRLEPGKFYEYDGEDGTFLIGRQEGETLLVPETLKEAEISADNRGGYVISGKVS